MPKEVSEPSFYDRLTLGVVKSLEKRQGICDVKLEQRPPVEKHTLLSWEQKHSCILPEDVKSFFLTTNGFRVTWNVRMNETRIPVGRMEVNPLENVIRIGGSPVSANSNGPPTPADLEDDDDETVKDLIRPHFDQRSRIFELDPCDSNGKVCLVYNDTKSGIPAQKAEIWFLDKSLQWHFLSENFLAYYRLLLLHLGLPQWQYAFTDIGLSPQAQQWFQMYAPVRLDYSLNQSREVEEEDSSLVPSPQLDAGKVFKGKPDKKKPSITTQKPGNIRRPPASTSARSQGSLGSRTSQTINNKPAAK